MGVTIRVDGIDRLAKLSSRIRAEGDKGLGRQMGRALDKVVEPLKRSIDASAGRTMPSGYRGVLTRSLKHRRSIRATAREASLRLATFAEGRKERRNLPALEAGELRHPVYGRVRPTRKGPKANPWATTRIRPGFHRRGVEKAAGQVEKELQPVLDDFADRLMKG